MERSCTCQFPIAGAGRRRDLVRLRRGRSRSNLLVTRVRLGYKLPPTAVRPITTTCNLNNRNNRGMSLRSEIFHTQEDSGKAGQVGACAHRHTLHPSPGRNLKLSTDVAAVDPRLIYADLTAMAKCPDSSPPPFPGFDITAYWADPVYSR